MGDKKSDWTGTNIRLALHEKIKKTLETDTAKEAGLTSVTQFVDVAIRDMLAKLETTRMTHVNMYDDHVKIMDNDLERRGRIVSVFFKRDENAWCDYCGDDSCIHVQFAWEIPGAREILAKNGLNPPPSRTDR